MLDLPAGDYTLTVDGKVDATGDYQFILWSLAQATALTPGTPVSGSLSPRTRPTCTNSTLPPATGSTSTCRPVAGRPLPGGCSSIRTATFCSTRGSIPSGDVDTLTLPRSGRYTLLIEGRMLDTGSNTYTFNVQPVTISSTALTLGSPSTAASAYPASRTSTRLRSPSRPGWPSMP